MSMHPASRLIIVFSVLAACSSGDANPPPGVGDAGASLDALRTAFCKAARACCAGAGSPIEPLADCESEFDRQVPFVALVIKGTVLVDESKLGKCVTRLDEQAVTCQPTEYACAGAFSGTLAEGDACERADECRRSIDRPIACLKTNVTADSGPKSGECRAIPIGKSGDPCSRSCGKGDNCSSTISTFENDPVLTLCREDDALYCDSTRHCVPLLADGASCSSAGCASTSFCSGVCTPQKGEGSPCASFTECRAGLRCTNGSCAPTPFATAKLCSGDFN
jgi:hypothetical protein